MKRYIDHYAERGNPLREYGDFFVGWKSALLVDASNTTVVRLGSTTKAYGVLLGQETGFTFLSCALLLGRMT